jgi:hypothetical protein
MPCMSCVAPTGHAPFRNGLSLLRARHPRVAVPPSGRSPGADRGRQGRFSKKGRRQKMGQHRCFRSVPLVPITASLRAMDRRCQCNLVPPKKRSGDLLISGHRQSDCSGFSAAVIHKACQLQRIRTSTNFALLHRFRLISEAIIEDRRAQTCPDEFGMNRPHNVGTLPQAATREAAAGPKGFMAT